MVTRHARHIRATLKALSKVFVNIIQLLSLCEDKMAICSPEDNIFFLLYRLFKTSSPKGNDRSPESHYKSIGTF